LEASQAARILTAMKLSQITFCSIAILAMITGCRMTPRYQGDGTITNTSYFADSCILCYTTQYTIRLASFDMSTNFQREFSLGQLSFFREPKVTLGIRFKDSRTWEHFSKLHPRELKLAARLGWQNKDEVKSRMSYRFSNQWGTFATQPEMPLKDFIWSGAEFDRAVGREIEIGNQLEIPVPRGSVIKLWFSYRGDTSLTNRADLVVTWQWK
jgi:hypothetical protein